MYNLINIGTHIDPDEKNVGIEIDLSGIGKRPYSMAFFGSTGSGKTYEACKLLCKLADAGQTVLVLDIHRTMAVEMIPAELADAFEARTNRFDAYCNPIPCHLMEQLQYPKSVVEKKCDTASFITETISDVHRLGDRQFRLCKAAIKQVIQNESFKTFGIKALAEELFKCGKKDVADSVADRLESLFEHNAFVDGDLPLEPGKINVFDLSKYVHRDQIIIAELLLYYIFRRRYVGKGTPLFICIDEFQNIGMKKDGILSTILAEGRRLGINTILITQSMKIHFNEAQIKVIMQSAYKFFFRPSEADAVEFAKILGAYSVSRYLAELNTLKIGEFLLSGPVLGNGYESNCPIKIERDNGNTASSRPVGVGNDIKSIKVMGVSADGAACDPGNLPDNTSVPGRKLKIKFPGTGRKPKPVVASGAAS